MNFFAKLCARILIGALPASLLFSEDSFFKQKTAYEIGVRLVGSEMCIRDSSKRELVKESE